MSDIVVDDPEVYKDLKEKFGLGKDQIMRVVSSTGPQFEEVTVNVKRGTFIPVALDLPEKGLNFKLGHTYVDNIRYEFWIGVESRGALDGNGN
ncbi:MAG: hypothetical protein K8E24_003055 [Methanobacterium paludis]|nr:hypothetical protein [Methanobacterium paludis]